MTRENRVVMEMRNVSETERPHAILRFTLNGFSTKDIIITRTDATHYDMVAVRILP